MLDAIAADRMATGLNATPGVSAIAGYVGGSWPTWAPFNTEYGSRLPVLSIAISSNFTAHCLDVEAGDATNAVAAGWYNRMVAAKTGFICFYTSVSNANALVGTLQAAGIPRDNYWLWTAHYGVGQHICSPSCYRGSIQNADATQYSDNAAGPCDVSILSPAFQNALNAATGHNPVPLTPAPPIVSKPKVASTLNLKPSGNAATQIRNGLTNGFIWNDGSIWLATSGFPAGVPFTILDATFKGAFKGREVAKVASHGKYGYTITATSGETYTLGN